MKYLYVNLTKGERTCKLKITKMMKEIKEDQSK